MKEDTKDIEIRTPGHDEAPLRESLKSSTHTTIGDLVAAAFDEAAHYTSDLRSVSLLATQAVTRLLRRARSRSSLTGATRGVVSNGRRLPARGSAVPVSAQVRVAVYAAASSSSRRRSTRAPVDVSWRAS